MSSLPIDTLKPQFDQLISQHDLVVEAETGSGKSTRLPLWAAERGRVLVIEPRRIACTSLAQFLAQQAGERVGQFVGYAIKLESHYDEKTQVVFVTPGVALRWYADNQLADFDFIVVDEFHERRWDTDLLVALLNERAAQRLIVTSATMEGERLARYLGAKRLCASGRQFDVALYHRAQDAKQLPDVRHLDERILREVIGLENTPGDILVFLPGRKEINQCVSRLSSLDNIVPVPLHASVSDQQREIALKPQSYKKVVLATNVAETSLTIPNISAVIDSGLERRTEQRNGRTTLSLKHISKASAKQRAGRAGRVMRGECVRLYGEFAALTDVTPPEMHRESLTEAMLAAACCGTALTQLSFLEALPEKSLVQAEQVLLTMNAISSNGLATDHGRRLYPLPIDALYADLVTRMPTRPLQEAMLDLTSVLATPATLYRLTGDEQLQMQLDQEEPLGCDAQLAIGLVRGKVFSRVNVDQEVLREARLLAEQMRQAFELPELSVASRYQPTQLGEAIASLHPELVFVRREKRREAFANGEMEAILTRDSRIKTAQEALLVLDTHSVPGRGVKQTINLATVTIPLRLALLEEMNLGEWQQGEVMVQEAQTLVERHLVYAGRTVATRYEAAKGELAIQPILQAVIAEAVLPGLAKRRSQEIEHWKIYQGLGLADAPSDGSTLTFESWFTEQLSMLGVNEIDELAMFEAEDFLFDGIPDWQYQEFAEQYPFELALGDLNLDVEYQLDKKRVYVVYRDGLRKGYPKRWELPKWQGWRVQYKRASKIVDVR
ncbi:ATP-dependent RNA helicase [Vibrio sp. JPW-9-11-11]|uniref:helicase-related protein n=1 Tax=Vibrio sp. JPW-9-11-11 TaxID=1416532 RepID=UPI0015945375|nr:helicase-related protein [Vibrio sp. JPW-9-11-11]NVD06855.1 ATP-dependent RNA helicase [Vibrio sp. JPW-9-11-11]